MKKKIKSINFIMITILLLAVTACGQKSEENKNASVSTNDNDMFIFIEAYKKEILNDRTSIKECAETYDQQIDEILVQDNGTLDFSNCDFADFPDINSMKVMYTENHGITVEESWNAIEEWLKQIGKYDQVDMKNEVHVISPELGMDESKEYPDCYELFYENKDRLSSGEGAFINNQLCHIQIAVNGIYSMSNGKITERLGKKGKSASDALGVYTGDVVEEGLYAEMKDISYMLNGNDLTIEEGAELVKTYFMNGTPFKLDKAISVDIPEVRVFQIGDSYGYDYMVRRNYEGVPFAYRDYGESKQPDSYSVTPDIKHAYVIDETGVCAFAGYNESEKLNIVYEDSKMIDLESACNISKSGLAKHLAAEISTAGIVYLPVDMAPFEVDSENMVYPCWELKGVNTTKNENILIYVDVFTGEIYYYTTTMDENE